VLRYSRECCQSLPQQCSAHQLSEEKQQPQLEQRGRELCGIYLSFILSTSLSLCTLSLSSERDRVSGGPLWSFFARMIFTGLELTYTYATLHVSLSRQRVHSIYPSREKKHVRALYTKKFYILDWGVEMIMLPSFIVPCNM